MILPTTATLCARLGLAAIFGTILGAERSFHRKDAGIRTHSILALATALFMILSKYAFFDDQGGADPTMIASQIVMGINFLGAGIIFRSRQVASHGLTTAAGVWGTAGIGMACGCGLLIPAGVFTFMILILHLLVHRLDLFGTAYTPQELRLTVENTPEIWPVLKRLQEHYRIRVLSAHYKRRGGDISMILQVQMPGHIPLQDKIHLLDQYHQIKEIE